MIFHSKKGAILLNNPFTLEADCFKKLSDMEHITFEIRAFQVTIVTKIKAGQFDQVRTEGLLDMVFGCSDNPSTIV